ncbi:MAG: ABC transporter substrate-binding protein [Pseudomonadota bacterium]
MLRGRAWSIVFAVACLLSSCGQADRIKDDTIVVSVRSNVGPFDPAVFSSAEQVQILHPVYQNLVSIAQDTDTGADVFQPELAVSWRSSDDKLSWTFELSEDQRFDDGAPVDAAAVVFTIERLLAIGRAPSSGLGGILEGVEAVDDWTVVFRLREPVPSLLPYVSDSATFIVNPRILEHEIDGDLATEWLNVHTAGSGPYRLSRFTPRETYVLDANPYAPAPPVSVKRIIFRVASDPAIRALLLRKGDLDMAYFLPAEVLADFQSSDRFVAQHVPTKALNYLAFNMQTETFADVRLRRAIALAIDYEAIVRDVKYGLADPYNGPLLPGMPGYTSADYPYEYDPSEAARLVREIASEQPIPRLQMIYPGVSAGADTMAVFVQSSLAEIGLEVELQRLTVPALINRIDRGNFDFMFMGWVSVFGDPSNIVNYWFDPERIGAAGNYARYDNPRVAELVRASLTETDAAARARQLSEIVALTNQDLPYVYLVKNAVWPVYSTRLEGIELHEYNVFDPPFSQLQLTVQETGN